jgi:hypothetical protein
MLFLQRLIPGKEVILFSYKRGIRMNAEIYSTKHQYIRQDLNLIEETAAAGIDEKSAAVLAVTINRLTAVLKMHLASEDTYLYPALLKSSDERVRRITKTYMDEMGDLSQNYTAFHDAWNTGSKIRADSTGFLRQFHEISAALTIRMDREEQELYRF